MALDARNLGPGDRVGHYRIEECIGAGGMAMVFRGHDERLRRSVAIKVMLSEFAAQPEGRDRFLREGRAAARLEHPNIVYVLDLDVDGGVPYCVMEYMNGEDLRALLERVQRLTTSHAISIVAPIARALSFAHKRGIIHRDVKPENIFLARAADGSIVPKLLDFGIARVVGRNSLNDRRIATGTGMLIGTPHYMSPEQVHCDKAIDGRSDQYSLGVVLYELLTGRKPFHGDSLHSLLNAIVLGECSSARERERSVPLPVDLAVRRAMRVQKDERFADAENFASALEEAEVGAGGPSLAEITGNTRRPSLGPNLNLQAGPAVDTPHAGTSLPVILPKARMPILPTMLGAVSLLLLCLFVLSTPSGGDTPRAPSVGVTARPPPAIPTPRPATLPQAMPPESVEPPPRPVEEPRVLKVRTTKARRRVHVGANDSLIIAAP